MPEALKHESNVARNATLYKNLGKLVGHRKGPVIFAYRRLPAHIRLLILSQVEIRACSVVRMKRTGIDLMINIEYYKLMKTSTNVRPAKLLDQMSKAAKALFATDSNWAKASGLPKETLSRLKRNPSCDLQTLGALARTAGYTLVAVPASVQGGEHLPNLFDREYEDDLLNLCAPSNVDPDAWRAHGPGFFMGGLAVLLASARGFERERYLRLAEALHPGISTPEVFALWLQRSALRAGRFLPMARRRRGLA